MSGSRRARVLVYGDVDLNLLDGSAVWVPSVAESFARAGCEVSVLLREPVRNDRLVAPMTTLPGVTVLRPHADSLLPELDSRGLSRAQVLRIVRQEDERDRFDAVVLRGLAMASSAAAVPELAGRLWVYLTDIPQRVADLGAARLGELERIATASRLLLCQTEELRCYLEAVVPAAAGCCVLLPPVVPETELQRPADVRPSRDGLRLVYMGKFAPHWRTLEMTALPRLLRAKGIAAELHMVGDKVHQDPAAPGWYHEMTAALRGADGVTWHGGHPRAEAMRLSATCHVGLGWRASELDDSLELSTKVLELGSLGVPVVLNRTPMHEHLLGDDYPLFGWDESSVLAALEQAATRPEVYDLAVRRCADAAAAFTMPRAAERVAAHLDRAKPTPPAVLAGRTRPLRVLAASHDWKFFTRLLDHLSALPAIDVAVDDWPALAEHDEAASRELASWADVVVCEWCGPNAAWYSRNKRRGQRLVVRLHRFELYTAYPDNVLIDAVDAVVCVSPHYARLTQERTGWPAEKIVTIPNWVDVEQLDRPKVPAAEFGLGVIGVAPMRKRLDLAVDVLARLRKYDDRYTLFCKTKMPWDYWWIWQKPEERAHYAEVLRRVRTDPDVAGAVSFDGFGGDVAGWLRKVGFVLSTSDDESFHLAPAEGMASGAVPALLPWPGADTVYDRRWIHEDTAAIAEAIHELVVSGSWERARAEARRQVNETFALDRVAQQWVDLLVGETAR